MITATLFSDPGCPWAYSESPALRVIEWRYGDQLDWRLVLIGLTESSDQYAARGYTPLRGALGQLSFRRFGMPFSPAPKPSLSATSRACRVIIAARQADSGSEWRVFRALQLANFTTPLVLEDDDGLREVIANLGGVDADAVVSAIDSDAVVAEYESDKALSRTAEGSATQLQGKGGNSDGAYRYTAPSVIFEREDGLTLEAGGFQPVEAYDVILANLDPTLARQAPPETPAPLLAHFTGGLTTAEVAACMTHGNDAVDRQAAEAALIELVDGGDVVRLPLGDDALWVSAAHVDQAPLATASLAHTI